VNKKRAGFSLIEILIGLAVIAVVMAGVNQVFFSYLKTEQKTRTVLEVKQNGDRALTAMATRIRNAEEVVCSGGGISLYNEEDEQYDSFSCSDFVGNYLSVESCSFSCNDDIVEIKMTLKKDSATRMNIFLENEIDFETKVVLRNY